MAITDNERAVDDKGESVGPVAISKTLASDEEKLGKNGRCDINARCISFSPSGDRCIFFTASSALTHNSAHRIYCAAYDAATGQFGMLCVSATRVDCILMRVKVPHDWW